MGSRVIQARAFLVEQIRAGMPPGAGVSVKVAAKELRISHTPVREALERLVGEGVLVSTPGRHGFATPQLTVRDLTNLHRLHGALLVGLNRTERRRTSTWKPDPSNPFGAVEEAIAQGCGPDANTMILSAIRAAELRLSTYRKVEPNVVPAWSAGLLRLRNGLAEGGAAGRDAVADFHGRPRYRRRRVDGGYRRPVRDQLLICVSERRVIRSQADPRSTPMAHATACLNRRCERLP